MLSAGRSLALIMKICTYYGGIKTFVIQDTTICKAINQAVTTINLNLFP